jgi:hypothetical protein
MHPIKRIIQSFANWPASVYLRNALGVKPKYYKEPTLNCSVSDLFFWRSDEVWRTRFDLLNLPSVLYPKQNVSDRVTFIFYNQQGFEFHREKYTVPPLQKIAIQVEDVIGDKMGFGSMAIFHETPEDSQFVQDQTCIAERGFASYRRVADDSALWSYVHGAAYLLSKSPGCDEVHTTRRAFGKNIIYRPQISFSDCDRFELIYINPNDSELAVKVNLLDQASKLIREESKVLPPRGVECIFINNKDRAVSRLENESRAYMWRPFILKYYETHFDILHS